MQACAAYRPRLLLLLQPRRAVRLLFSPCTVYISLVHLPPCLLFLPSAGELYDQIRLRGRLDEAATRFYTAEIVLMLEALRQEGVVHR